MEVGGVYIKVKMGVVRLICEKANADYTKL